jgi:hypothetical protein
MHPDYPVRRILVRKDPRADCWVAQCVDFDLMTQAKKIEDLPKAFGHVYYGEVVVALEHFDTVKFRRAPESAIINWANITERSTETRAIPWEQFVPDWLDGALGNLAKMYESLTPKANVEMKVALEAVA